MSDNNTFFHEWFGIGILRLNSMVYMLFFKYGSADLPHHLGNGGTGIGKIVLGIGIFFTGAEE